MSRNLTQATGKSIAMSSNDSHSLQVDDWVYRDEGHANIVIASRLSRDVLRLRKCFITPQTVETSQPDIDTSKWQQQLDYQNFVMRPLIGPEYVPMANLIQLPEGFVEEINRVCLSHRPAIRLNKAGDPSWRCGILLPDLALLPHRTNGAVTPQLACPSPNGVRGDLATAESPTFCIELKPKWGFLPSPPHASAGGGVKYTHCRFCMFQHLKMSKGKWTDRSRYCPLDLFSGNPARLRHAVFSILQTPQNNIRILKNAKQIFKAQSDGKASPESWQQLREACESLPEIISPDDDLYVSRLPEEFRKLCTKNVSSLVNITTKILQHDAMKTHHTLSAEGWKHIRRIPVCQAGTYKHQQHATNGHAATPENGESSDEVGDESPCGGALASIRLVQMLDDIDIEGIASLLKRLGTLDGGQWEKWGLNGPYKQASWTELSSQLGHGREAVDDGSDEFAVKKIRQFSVACTAKDCSVMIAFQKCEPGQDVAQDNIVGVATASGLQYFTYRIAVVDLDIKAFQRIQKYFLEDIAVVDHFTSKFNTA